MFCSDFHTQLESYLDTYDSLRVILMNEYEMFRVNKQRGDRIAHDDIGHRRAQYGITTVT